jgi:hypothetical protein
LKQDLPIVSIEAGMQIARSDEHVPNADSPKTETSQPVSNAKFERLAQAEKHHFDIILTDRGMQID